jgi:hypothetical protein
MDFLPSFRAASPAPETVRQLSLQSDISFDRCIECILQGIGSSVNVLPGGCIGIVIGNANGLGGGTEGQCEKKQG